MFSTGFRGGEPTESVAKVVHEAITTDQPKLRYIVGENAKGFITGHERIADESWISMGGDLSDAKYNQRFKDYFDITLQ